MRFLELFSSEERVNRALEQSVGYELPSGFLPLPVNENSGIEVDIHGKKVISIHYRRTIPPQQDDCWSETFVRRRS